MTMNRMNDTGKEESYIEADYMTGGKKERLFVESFERDSDLLDDKDLLELK